LHPKLSQYINRTVLISIPSLFADGHARPFKLLGVELHGLWLQSDARRPVDLFDDGTRGVCAIRSDSECPVLDASTLSCRGSRCPATEGQSDESSANLASDDAAREPRSENAATEQKRLTNQARDRARDNSIREFERPDKMDRWETRNRTYSGSGRCPTRSSSA
jgi:hypothetical protein